MDRSLGVWDNDGEMPRPPRRRTQRSATATCNCDSEISPPPGLVHRQSRTDAYSLRRRLGLQIMLARTSIETLLPTGRRRNPRNKTLMILRFDRRFVTGK
ncbi:hypothetical protein BDW62DRAFT_135188 [Aspergillus aurantiobrunneus]